jgi:hypothetical protein
MSVFSPLFCPVNSLKCFSATKIGLNGFINARRFVLIVYPNDLFVSFVLLFRIYTNIMFEHFIVVWLNESIRCGNSDEKLWISEKEIIS